MTDEERPEDVGEPTSSVRSSPRHEAKRPPGSGPAVPKPVAIAAAVLVAVAVIAFFVGRSSAGDDAPTAAGSPTLGAVLADAYTAELPCGRAAKPLTDLVDETCKSMAKLRQRAAAPSPKTEPGPTTTVVRRPELENPLDDLRAGVVQSLAAGQMVLDTSKGSVTEILTSTTQVLRVDPGSPSQLAVGVRVLVDEDERGGTRTARRVFLVAMDL